MRRSCRTSAPPHDEATATSLDSDTGVVRAAGPPLCLHWKRGAEVPPFVATNAAAWTRATCASRIVYIGALLRTLALPTPRPKQPLSSRSPLCAPFCAGTMRLLAAVGAAISSARPPPTTRDPRARPCRAMWRASRPLPWCVGRGMRRAPFGPRASAESAWRMVSRQHGPLCAGACRSCVRSIALAPGAPRRVLLDGPRRTARPPCACLSSRRCYACSCVTTELVPRSGRNDCIRYCIDSDMIAYVE